MLKIENLTVEISNDQFYILKDLSLELNQGEILGLAGESGSGKSMLTKTILGLIEYPIKKTNGNITINNNLITDRNVKNMRGSVISTIFQNPQSSLNPVMTIGKQLIETIMLHNKKLSKIEAQKKAVSLLQDVEIDNPEARLSLYPHQLSGGMNQRIMIAIALASDPEILIADEPTTALDVTIQQQIIKLLYKLNKNRKLTILFISHDLSLLATICNRVAVLYSGELLEIIESKKLFAGKERHPYTKALKQCIPTINNKEELVTIKGNISKNDFSYNEKCIFADRCDKVQDICLQKKPIFSNNCKCFF